MQVKKFANKLKSLQAKLKPLAGYYTTLAVSLLLLVFSCYAWFTMISESHFNGASIKAYSNNLDGSVKVFKNGAEMVNAKNIFAGLLPDDVLRFEITVTRQDDTNVVLDLGIEGIFSDTYSTADGQTYLTSSLFTVFYENRTFYLSDCDSNGKLVLSDAVQWDDGELKKVINVSIKFTADDGLKTNDFAKKQTGFSGFYINIVA